MTPVGVVLVRRPSRRIWAAVVFGLGAVAFACEANEAASCGPTSALAARVIDGDTMQLAGGETVRYLMLDAPEWGPPAECYASESTAFLREAVEGRMVALSYDRQCTDDYGRLLAYVTVAERDVNATLVERGYACVLQIPPNGRARADELTALQASARTRGQGLWGRCATALPRCARRSD